MAILNDAKGATDVFGKAYVFPAGGKDADAHGDSRPFQTEPHFVHFKGENSSVRSGNDAYLRSERAHDLGYTEGLLLAILVPQRYRQMVARAVEYGNDRIILGVHYAMDVLAARTLAEYDLAQLLANKPDYLGARNGVKIEDFPLALAAARADLTKALEAAHAIDVCAKRDESRLAHAPRNRALYEATQTYGLPAVSQRDAEDVGKLAPEAGLLLTAAFPYLKLAEPTRF